MKKYRYPSSWSALSCVPSARWELISILRDIADWNKVDSRIRLHGTDDLIDFLFDVNDLDQFSDHLVGKLIFRSELPSLAEFADKFSSFINRQAIADPQLDQLHEMSLPDEVRISAERLYRILAEKGLPEEVGS